MDHALKTPPAYFAAVRCGNKTFEIRDNSDRGFQKGDKMILREIKPSVLREQQSGRITLTDVNPDNLYTGREILTEITYVTNFRQIQDYVVIGFKFIEYLDGSDI